MKHLILYCMILSTVSCLAQQDLKNSLFDCLAGSPPYLARTCHDHAGKDLKKLLQSSGKFTDKNFRRKTFPEKIMSWWGVITFEKIQKEFVTCYRNNKCDKVGRLECRRSAGRELERLFKAQEEIDYSLGDESKLE